LLLGNNKRSQKKVPRLFSSSDFLSSWRHNRNRHGWVLLGRHHGKENQHKELTMLLFNCPPPPLSLFSLSVCICMHARVCACFLIS
jgi:hypothetical protein